MISYHTDNPYYQQGIAFDDEGKDKVIKLFERAINTWSPPDPELVRVLDELKEK